MTPQHFVQRLTEKLDYWSLLSSKTVVQTLRPSQRRERVFVAGAQRSGTNMLMELLERSYQTQVYHERDPRAFQDYQMRERAVIQGLANDCRAPLMVIKALCESEQLAELMTIFAPARSLWMVRPYLDVVNSSLRAFGNQVEDSVRRMVKDPSLGGWRGRRMSSSTLQLLRDLNAEQLDDASAVALFWYVRNILFFEQQLEHRDDVLVIYYNHLVTDIDTQGQRLFDFLALDFKPAISRRISASSIGRHPHPTIDPAVAEVCDGLMQRFEPLFGP